MYDLKDRPVIIDRVNLIRSVEHFTRKPEFDGFSRVTLILEDETEITAGNDTGRELRYRCAFATPQIAQNVLDSLRGYQYQPYDASTAFIDPAAELMDGVTINGIYGGIYGLDADFSGDYTARVYADQDEEIDHEAPFVSQEKRGVIRKFQNVYSELRITADQIAAEVKNRENADEELRAGIAVQAGRITAEAEARSREDGRLSGRLDVQAGQIAAKVSQQGGDSSTFGWALVPDHFSVSAGSREVFRVDKRGAQITGEIRANAGTIGGFEILSDRLSYNSQTWGGSNSRGIYIGVSGFQLGSWENGCHIDNSGHIYANSGTFRGNVDAGKVSYGGSHGSLSGEAISSESIGGHKLSSRSVGSRHVQLHSISGGGSGHISLGSVSTSNTTSGINSSLGNADFASDVCRGYQTASEMSCNSLTVVSNLKFRGAYCYPTTVAGKRVLGIG